MPFQNAARPSGSIEGVLTVDSVSDLQDRDDNSILVVRRVMTDHPLQKEIRNECYTHRSYTP